MDSFNLFAQNAPSDIGAKLFARHDVVAAPPSGSFNQRATFSGNLADAFAPLTDSRWRDAKHSRHFRLATQDGAGPDDCLLGCLHGGNVASLQVSCKAMLHSSMCSIASMKDFRIWTIEEEAANLAKRFEGVNQADFARRFEVPGGASMLSQHIKGRRPMNMDSALAYMKGFGVALEEISPRLAKQMYKALADLESSKAASAAPNPTPAEPPPAPPPRPPADFNDGQRAMTESDWITLDAVTAFVPQAQLEEMRQRYLAFRESVAADLERRKAAAVNAAANALAGVAEQKASEQQKAEPRRYRKQHRPAPKTTGKKSGSR